MITFSVSALLTAPAFASSRRLHLVFVERAATDTTNHVGKGDDNTGDILTFPNNVFDQKDQSQSGLTRAIASAWCQGRPTSASGRSPLFKVRS